MITRQKRLHQTLGCAAGCSDVLDTIRANRLWSLYVCFQSISTLYINSAFRPINPKFFLLLRQLLTPGNFVYCC